MLYRKELILICNIQYLLSVIIAIAIAGSLR